MERAKEKNGSQPEYAGYTAYQGKEWPPAQGGPPKPCSVAGTMLAPEGGAQRKRQTWSLPLQSSGLSRGLTANWTSQNDGVHKAEGRGNLSLILGEWTGLSTRSQRHVRDMRSSQEKEGSGTQ